MELVGNVTEVELGGKMAIKSRCISYMKLSGKCIDNFLWLFLCYLMQIFIRAVLLVKIFQLKQDHFLICHDSRI